jgi:toxin ParE1/3/4
MNRALFTVRARTDLKEIVAYTLRVWGKAQAAQYLDSVESHVQRLADLPLLGRPCQSLGRDLRRSEHEKHVIFYRRAPHGITISRILHQRMLLELHPIDDADPVSE